MTQRSLLSLLLVTGLLLGLWLVLPESEQQSGRLGSEGFLPELAAGVNDLDRLEISTAEARPLVTLQREESAWTVEQAGGYAADWEVIRPMLLALAQARVIEPKTANPEYYARLGVEDLTEASPGSEVVRISLGADNPVVLLGNEANGREGQYARIEGEAGSVLLDRAIDVPAERSGWLQSEIVDVADSEVVELEITHSDGASVQARKDSASDTDFTLQGIPEGQEIKSAWGVNSLAGLLSGLELDDVRAGDVNEEGALALIDYRVLTAGGLELHSRLVELPAEGDGASTHWLSIRASAPAESATEETLARAEEINSRTTRWSYRIPQYKFNSVNKRMSDLLAAPAGEEDS